MRSRSLGETVAVSALVCGVAVSAAQPVYADEQAQVQAKDPSHQEQQPAELGAVMVTGERVGRALEDTAASVEVFDDNRLAELPGAERIEQVLDGIPNLQRGAGETGVTIRGQDTTGVLIGANAFLGGTRPRATLQIDGRALNFNEFIYGLTSIWDVEQIEVFRGPQTTTQGRNAIAGSVFVKTKDPTFEPEGSGRFIAGNYDTRQASFALSGPLVDNQLAARIAVDWREHDSWMKYTAPDVFEGVDREDDNYANARAKFLYVPAAIPELDVLLTLSHVESSNPQGETADEPYADRVQNVQNGAHWKTDVDSVILETNYALDDAWELSFTGTLADSESERFASRGFGTALVEAEEYSVEGVARFNPSGGSVRGLLGVSYFVADQDESSDLSAFLGFGDFTDKQNSSGVFAEMTFDATSRLHLTVGGRWQQDEQERSGTLGPVSLDYDETFDAFLPKAEIAYDLRENVVIGASARKGFNPGGTTVSFTTGEIDEFDEETLWSYELFSRATLAGGDLVLSGNLFFTDFTDAQRPQITLVTLPGGITAETTEFANAPKAESYGLEFSSLWRATDTLQVRALLGYLETEITETVLPDDPMLGKEFQRAPNFTASLGLNYLPTHALTVDLDARYNSSYYSDDANTPEFEIDSVTVLDARVGYDFGNIEAFAYVRNLADKTYQLWQFRPGNSWLGDPREYGIGMEANF